MSDYTAELPESQPPPAGRNKRGLIAVVASVVAVVLIAGGGVAAWKFFLGGGPRPAEVLPGSTFALVTVDLNPSGGQKVEAIKTLRKFPSWKKRTGVTPDSDVLKAIFDEAFKKGPCKALDYERDVKPWIGNRAGFGGVLLGESPAPVFALQITDPDKARTGFAKLVKCADAGDDEFGFTTTDDYVIASDSTSHAKAIAAAGKKSTLAENADFQKWTDEVGGPGIMNAYMGPKSIQILSESTGSGLDEITGGDPAAQDQLADAFKKFKGGAAGLKFADGGMELAVAGGAAADAKTATVGKHVGDLPKDTAAVLALAVPPKFLDKLRSSSSKDLLSMGDFLTAGTGLKLPDDLITVLGSSLSISVGGDAPANLKDISNPADLPIGLLIHGDETKIKAVVAKVEANTGANPSDIPATLASKDGKVALSTTSGYADDLLGNGSLADSKTFKDVVSHADEAQSVFYMSLDNEWMDRLRDQAVEENDKDFKEVVDNLAVLRAVGAGTWSDGDTRHGLLRIALK
ncbi:MAG: DUF3352 domain-containing protein [Marmoricola sp.]